MMNVTEERELENELNEEREFIEKERKSHKNG